MIELRLQYQALGSTDLVHRQFIVPESLTESEWVLSILELLHRYASLLANTERYLRKESYIRNLRYQLEMQMQQVSYQNQMYAHLVQEVAAQLMIQQQPLTTQQLKRLEACRTYYVERLRTEQTSSANWMARIAVHMLSPMLTKRLGYAGFQRTTFQTDAVLSYLREQRIKEIQYQAEGLRMFLRRWFIYCPQEVQQQIWAYLIHWFNQKKETQKLMDFSAAVPAEQKLQFFVEHAAAAEILAVFRAAEYVQKRRSVQHIATHTLEQYELLYHFFSAIKQHQSKALAFLDTISETERAVLTEALCKTNLFHAVQEKKTLAEILSNFTEEEQETFQSYLAEQITKSTRLQELFNHLTENGSLIRYVETLSETERTALTEAFRKTDLFHAVQEKKMLAESLSNLTEEEQETFQSYLAGQITKSTRLQELFNRLTANRSLAGYVETLSETERAVLSEAFRKTGLFHAVQEKKTLAESLSNLTEEEQEYFQSYLAEQITKSTRLQELFDRLTGNRSLAGYVETLSETERAVLTEAFRKTGLFHAVQENEAPIEMISNFKKELNTLHYHIQRWINDMQIVRNIEKMHLPSVEKHNLLPVWDREFRRRKYAAQEDEKVTIEHHSVFSEQTINLRKYMHADDVNDQYTHLKIQPKTESVIEKTDKSNDLPGAILTTQPALQHAQSGQATELPEAFSEQLELLTRQLQSQEQRLTHIIRQAEQDRQSAVSLYQMRQTAEDTVRRMQHEIQDAQRRNGWFS